MNTPRLKLFCAGVLLLGGLLSLGGCDDDATEPAPGVTANNGDGQGPAEGRDPGRVTIRRLNRAGYNNTVRDLLGTEQRPADDFPADDHGYGFDNIGDVLSLSPLLLELYQRAAETLVDEALHIPRTEPALLHYEAEALDGSVGGVYRDEGWNLWSNGTLGPTVEIPQTGDYRVAVRAFGQQAGPDPARMTINVNGVTVAQVDVEATADAPQTYEVLVHLEQGVTTVEAEFINDFYDPELAGDRNLIIDWIEVEGPLGVEGDRNPIRERLVTCDPATMGEEPCAAEVLGGFAARAWRWPLHDGELEGLMEVYRLARAEADFDAGLGVALQGVLGSPFFVFRAEIDPTPTDLTAHTVSAYELANRLSYFLWSSMPDEQLFQLAEDGTLHDEAVLQAQIDRMIDDPRARALVDNFAGQWLYTRALADVQPDYPYFPDFDEELRASMKEETELFFEAFLHEGLGMDEMFTADFTTINDRLATHYGMAPVGEGFHRVSLEGTERRGLLTQGAVLTVTSYPTRTSPVKRGKWVLTQLLCSEPPPPESDDLTQPDS